MGRRRGAPRDHRPARRGALALAMLVLLGIFLGLAMWVLNWVYLVLVHRSMQQRTDMIALAGAPALLDEESLMDAAGGLAPDQSDDVAEARAVAHRFREANNSTVAPALSLERDDVRVRAGFIADVTGESGQVHFDAAPIADVDQPHNALKVAAVRSAARSNPVSLLLHGLFGADSADVSAGSLASLDNLVVGFRPTPTANSPVTPLAIDMAAWRTERVADADGNEINELELRLKSPLAAALPANAALVAWDAQSPINLLVAEDQIELGVSLDDLHDSGGVLGPATPSAPRAVPSLAALPNAMTTRNFARAFNRLAASHARACRVFALYDPHASSATELSVVGFIAARVQRAVVADQRLVVFVEPCFLLHHTAWTESPTNAALAPERNAYIHKLRLSR